MKLYTIALLLTALAYASPSLKSAPANSATTQANVPVEISFSAARLHADPFNEVELDVIFTEPNGTARKVPAFWAGGTQWKVRFASALQGIHRWRSACSDARDRGLQGLEGTVQVTAFTGENPSFRHGPLRVSADKRHLEHLDGTPFFWLGDTWWMGLCNRLHWPDEFKELTADRKAKGFTLIQMVAGLYPDMHPFDPRGANEAGYPWETNYSRIRPEYFDAADQRLRHLVDEGLTPCIVGAWGYFIPWMGVEKMNKHWRYLIARYGAWPVVWCVAGEANLPWYLAKGFPYDDRKQVHEWTQVMRFVRETDPFHRPLTIHPTGIGRLSARNATEDVSLLDIDFLQTPHGQREAVAPTIRTMRESYPDKPTMPVINGEAAYEMLFDKIPAEWPRAMFWVCMMNGAAGHTYGANGIWQLNRRGKPHGASPNGTGNGYGVISWDEAMRLPGSQQLSFGKKFLESLPWTELKPMPEAAQWAETWAQTPLGDWIWFGEGDPKRDAPVGARFFRRAFKMPEKQVSRALLRIAADDRFTVWLNGKELGSEANWKEPKQYDVTGMLKTGDNLLAVRAENLNAPVALNPAGLTTGVAIEFADGSKKQLSTDAAWRAAKTETPNWRDSAFDDSAWATAVVTAKFGQGPWGSIGGGASSIMPQASGIGDRVRVVYALDPRPLLVRSLQPDATYRVTHFDPVSGSIRPAGPALKPTGNGEATIDPPAHGHDWVLLLEKNDGGTEASQNNQTTFAEPKWKISGDWEVTIPLQNAGGRPHTLEIPRPKLIIVTSEKFDTLPVFNPKAGGWVKGAQLRGVRAQETTTPYLLVPESLVLRGGPSANAEVFQKGTDYEADLSWGTIGRLANGRIKADQPVYASYRHAQLRLDAIVLAPDGRLILREGEPRAAAPLQPSLNTGERHLANIWLPGLVPKLAPEHLFPVLETTYPEPPKSIPTPVEKFAPRALQKLRDGKPLRLLAWGDSVTVGTYVPNPAKERWQEQFVARLQERFPKAKIQLVTEAWGGRNTGSYLGEPPGSEHNYREKVLGAKPDLVVSEFVNDAGLNPKQVEERYSKLLADFQGIGAEWIILTPHYVRPDWMNLNRERDIDNDPRPYVAGLRTFASKHDVALADASLRYGRLWRQGIPYSTLMLNSINHPDPRGMKIFADALMELFPSK